MLDILAEAQDPGDLEPVDDSMKPTIKLLNFTQLGAVL